MDYDKVKKNEVVKCPNCGCTAVRIIDLYEPVCRSCDKDSNFYQSFFMSGEYFYRGKLRGRKDRFWEFVRKVEYGIC